MSLPPLQGLDRFLRRLPQGDTRGRSFALGYHLPGLQPFQFAPPHIGCYAEAACTRRCVPRVTHFNSFYSLSLDGRYSPPSQRRLRISLGPCHALPGTFTFWPSFTISPLGLRLNSVTVRQWASGAVILGSMAARSFKVTDTICQSGEPFSSLTAV